MITLGICTTLEQANKRIAQFKKKFKGVKKRKFKYYNGHLNKVQDSYVIEAESRN